MECNPLRVYMKERGMESDPFLRRALEYIEAHSLFAHIFFREFAEGRLSIEQVRVWVMQRLFSSQLFASFLGAFLLHLPDGPARQVFIRQKSEEEGDGDPEKAHSKYLKRLVRALGVSPQELTAEVMLPGTRDFVATFRRISCEGDILKGMGMYALGEIVIAMEMELLLKGLNTIPGLSSWDKEYCSLHALLDAIHAAQLLDALRPYLQTPSDEEQALEGIVEIIDARNGLYDGIARKIGLLL